MKYASTVRAIVLAVAVAAPLVAQQTGTLPPLTQKLGVGPEFVIGVLPNGLHYYIRKNALPAKRAELRLAVNAGAVLEDDDQQGYAHFVEHTAFNGTTHFKKNDLVKYLESIGTRFGADLNASTAFDETIYQLSVPTDTARLLESGLTILEDWAHGQLFDSTEVVNERGVVLEEWRGRLGAGQRMQDQFLPIILKGSKYAQRNVIGYDTTILKAQPSVLRRFYRDWYRPDLMAVIAVGDFDVPTVEASIKKHFSGIPAVQNPRPRGNATVPANAAPLIAVVSDAEATSSTFTLGYKRPRKIVTTVGDFRQAIVERLWFTMLNARLAEIAQKPDAPFLFASSGMQTFIARNASAVSFSAAVKDGGIEKGAEAVLTEAWRVNQFGFLPTELQRAKDNVARSLERAYTERDKTSSGVAVNELIRAYLEDEDIPGIAAEYDMTKQLLPGITVDEVNSLGKGWLTEANRIALVTVPKKSSAPAPTEAQMAAVFDRAAKATVTAYTETVGNDPLIDRMPAAGKVVVSKTIDAVGVTEWKLSNGARVLVKPTDFKADEVLLNAYSPGGTSLVSNADFMSASQASLILSVSGLGRFNATDLSKKLAGKAANVSAQVGQTSENLAGTASPKDIETLFQQIYLRFTAPRLDTTAWQAMKGRIEAGLANRNVSPQAAYADTIGVTLSQNNFRSRPPSAATMAEINPQRALEIYKDRFSNAGDFTFVFVGNVQLDSLKPLVEKYLASLPTTGRVETWKDVAGSPPTGVVEKTVRKGTAPQAETRFYFTGPFNYTPQTRLEMLAMTTLAQMWLTDVLREEMGATYSPQLFGSGSKIPRSDYSIIVQYTSAPENVDKLSKSVFRVIDSLKAHEPSAADLAKVKEQIIRSRETQVKTNQYWAGNIGSRDLNGEDIGGLLGAYDAMVASLTAKQIQDAAKLYFNTKQYAKFLLLPEK